MYIFQIQSLLILLLHFLPVYWHLPGSKQPQHIYYSTHTHTHTHIYIYTHTHTHIYITIRLQQRHCGQTFYQSSKTEAKSSF